MAKSPTPSSSRRKRSSLMRSASSILLRSVMSRIITVKSFLRSEEHTSELQSHSDLVCRLLLEKKKKIDVVLVVETPVLNLIKGRTAPLDYYDVGGLYAATTVCYWWCRGVLDRWSTVVRQCCAG